MSGREELVKTARQKAERYCAYQERSHLEVRNKLYSLGLYSGEVDEIMVYLIETDFLNEERFAITWAGGKFRMKQWGKKKLEQGLKQKGVSTYCINKALAQIDPEDYEEPLLQLAKTKLQKLSGTGFHKKDQTGKYLIRKGYESGQVWDLLHRLIKT